MDGPSCVPPFGRSASELYKRFLPRVLQVFLILGVVCLTSFSGVREDHGLVDKPPTDTEAPVAPTDAPKPTKPPNTHVPTYKTDAPIASDTPVILTDTPIPTNTDDPNATPTNTPDCYPFSLTPTAGLIPGIPTCTPTPTLTGTEAPTDTVQPGGSTSTPKPTKTKAPTEMGGVPATPTVFGTSAEMGFASAFTPPSSGQGLIGSSAEPPSPTRNAAAISGSGSGTGLNPLTGVNGMPFILMLGALVMGGGLFFGFVLRERSEVFDPSLDGAAATLSIHPVTVGASGFSAWLAGEAPLLTSGEKVVLAKVADGIVAALHLSGRISDLIRISERGPQEYLQLTTGPRLVTAVIRGTGLVGG
jgi:hypothetical protein